MAIWNLRRFSNPAILRQINPKHLIEFLSPHRDFLTSRGVNLPSGEAPELIDLDHLTRVFLTPDLQTPGELIDSLYFVDELATSEGMDLLLGEAQHQQLALEKQTEPSPADIVVQVWLKNRDLLKRKHIENYLERVRSFETYQTAGEPRKPFRRPTDEALTTLTQDLDDWFEKRRRGRATRVIIGDHEESVWMLVRHGEPLKREESLAGNSASSVCYRPLKYDVLVYTPQIGELQIHGFLSRKRVVPKSFRQMPLRRRGGIPRQG